MTPLQRRILETLREYGPMGLRTLCEFLGRSQFHEAFRATTLHDVLSLHWAEFSRGRGYVITPAGRERLEQQG